jgi:hypothetical protein
MKEVEPLAAWLGVAAMVLVPPRAGAQSHEDVNNANNPLTPTIGLNLQDQWAPKLYGSDADTNAFLLRGTVPHRLFGMPQILRATVPFVTSPAADGSNVTGLGDLNLFDVFLFKTGGDRARHRPATHAPHAQPRQRRHRHVAAGLATVAIAPQKWGLLGASSLGSTPSPATATGRGRTTCQRSRCSSTTWPRGGTCARR